MGIFRAHRSKRLPGQALALSSSVPLSPVGTQHRAVSLHIPCTPGCRTTGNILTAWCGTICWPPSPGANGKDSSNSHMPQLDFRHAWQPCLSGMQPCTLFDSAAATEAMASLDLTSRGHQMSGSPTAATSLVACAVSIVLFICCSTVLGNHSAVSKSERLLHRHPLSAEAFGA
jgi:hypothetical protein